MCQCIAVQVCFPLQQHKKIVHLCQIEASWTLPNDRTQQLLWSSAPVLAFCEQQLSQQCHTFDYCTILNQCITQPSDVTISPFIWWLDDAHVLVQIIVWCGALELIA